MYNYSELSELVPELANHIKDSQLDYTSPAAVRLLNQALLLKDFNLNVTIPEGHLCPTIPNRTGYIKQIEILLKDVFKVPSDLSVIGIDIGTGTSCVYPLIGCARNQNWTFLATDIDDEIIKHAQNNVDMNPSIKDRITIIKNNDPLRIFPDSLPMNESKFKFVVCNPPFYADSEDLETRRAFKKHKPNSDRCEMSKSELGTDLGGEIGFIKKIIDESSEASLSTHISLFSCMLGMKESLLELLDHLHSNKTVKSFAFELLQIKHTCRYLLFWTFSDQNEIPKDPSTDRLKITAKAKRTQTIAVTNCESFKFEEYLKDLQSKYGQLRNDDCVLELIQNKWNRKYRRSPETAAAAAAASILPNKLQISITFNGELMEFALLNEDGDWELFLGFINHLRKEFKQ